MKRRLRDRIGDRAWSEIVRLLSCPADLPKPKREANRSASISADMPWTSICTALVNGTINRRNFRRTHAVMHVVETLGLTDGQYFARWISRHHPEWLDNSQFIKLNDWGTPVQVPACLLGTKRAFSPTSLRYLAHALWLKQNGHVTPGGLIVEIGVGYGGLAAMNALVSGASTILIDLPEVALAASIMMRDNGLERFIAPADNLRSDYCLVSNYAFTELCVEMQDRYLDQWIRPAARGIILSNAEVFANQIGGRRDTELVEWFCACGLDAVANRDASILGPADHACHVSLIHWPKADNR